MKLKLSSKTSNPNVRYIHPVKELDFGEYDNFFIQEIQQEVVTLSKSKLHQYKKICHATIATLGSTLMLGTRSFAASPHMETVPGLMPSDIIPYGIWAVVIMVVASAFLATICYILSGNMKILFRKKKNEAVQWQKDIVRGFIDVLAAPIIIGLITAAAILFFGHFGWYIKPFQSL